jgi:isoleucyl-tRNA synthetase
VITSPAVRAENLRFREEGVKELVAKVLLPWYNAYRFFFSQLLLLKKVGSLKNNIRNTILILNTVILWILEMIRMSWIDGFSHLLRV